MKARDPSADATPEDDLPIDLASIGLTGPWPALLAELRAQVGVEGAVEGRVSRAERTAATVATADGLRRCTWTARQPPPVTGDWVLISAGLDGPEQAHLLLGVAPRQTSMTRPTVHGQRSSVEPDQVLAANIDLVGIVVPLDQDLNVRRLERGLVMAWESGATPLVLLTKADLADDLERTISRASASAVGVDVLPLSTVRGQGLDDLRARLAPDRTLTLLGASGAGKSTLTNALVGYEALAIGDVRAVDGKGRHTTTHRELVAVPGGGAVLDTPGLRTLGIGPSVDGIAHVFPEIDELAAACRFRDCRHEREPGCAVLGALDAGELDADRYDGWSRLRAASENAALRADVAAFRAETRSMGKMYRNAQDEKARMRGED